MKIPSKITNFFVYGLGQSINLLSPLIVMPYLIKICQEDGLGKIGIAFSICLILNCIVDYSSYLNGTKEIVINKKNLSFLSQKVSDIYTYKTIICILLLCLFFIIILLFPTIKEKKLLVLSLPIILSQLLNPNWLLQGLEQFKLIAILNILSKVIYISCIFLFIKNREDYIWANFFLGISGVLVYFFSFLYINYKFNLKFSIRNIYRGINIIKNDFNICLSEFCLSIYQYFPILIVGYFTGNSTAGIYRVIEQIFSIFRTFIFMFFNFSYPTVCYDIENNLKNGLKTWKLYHSANLVIIFIGCSLVFVFSNYILDFFHVTATDKQELTFILKFAIIVPILLVISQSLRQLMFALNLSSFYTRIIYFSCSLSVILLSLLVYQIGLVGSFISMIIIEIIVVILYLIIIRKKYNKVI
ncbi:oligosaccharide flippase family protein [Empedobacter tilapiae]|uniref:oligosaccharide flippase family protein n=1 Tax=Empedobacter tilapiae TaxID=2491114 RepID=UPI0014578DD9